MRLPTLSAFDLNRIGQYQSPRNGPHLTPKSIHQACESELAMEGCRLRLVNGNMWDRDKKRALAKFTSENCRILAKITCNHRFDASIPLSHFSGYVYPVLKWLACLGIGDRHYLPLIVGDNTSEWPFYSIAKTRPSRKGCISILRLNPNKHWSPPCSSAIAEDIKIDKKKPCAIFRGSTTGFNWDLDPKKDILSSRCRLWHAIEKSKHNHQWEGSIDASFSCISPRLLKSKPEIAKIIQKQATSTMEIRDMLGYKYILAPEGNDVSTSLKWILASNSIPIMPSPSVESWLLEFNLVPWEHYAPVRPDFSDLAEVVETLNADIEAQKHISEKGKAYVARFLDSKKEELISGAVAKKFTQFSHGRIC